MYNVGIITPENAGAADRLITFFKRFTYNDDINLTLIGASPCDSVFDVIVGMSRSAFEDASAYNLSGDARLIVDTDLRRGVFKVSGGAQVISYGLNSRACVTASSVGDEVLTLCVQRSITNLKNEKIDEQEFTIPLADIGINPLIGMAAAALVCGAEIHV